MPNQDKEREAAYKLFDIYQKERYRDKFIEKAINTMTIGSRETAHLIWECFDIMIERELSE